jgi:carbon storage regulator
VIRIGDNIKITVIEIGGGRVRLGIDAPKDVVINRQEVQDEIDAIARVDAVVAARLEALANTGKPSPE